MQTWFMTLGYEYTDKVQKLQSHFIMSFWLITTLSQVLAHLNSPMFTDLKSPPKKQQMKLTDLVLRVIYPLPQTFPKLCSTTHFNISITNSERTVPQSWNQICSCAAQRCTINGKKCIKIRVNMVSRMDNFS